MTKRTELEQAIVAQEQLRGSIPDAVVDTSIATLLQQLDALDTAAPDEQRKLVTVLFADLAGWTQMASNMDPEDVQMIQQAYFAAVTPAIEQHGGAVEKYIGDAVLAVFGVPQAHEDDPERAVRAALAMQEAIVSLNNNLATSVILSSDPPSLSLRIGIHTGLVVSTVDATGDFVITGDTVNMASRLESAAIPGTVLVSEETYKLIAHAFQSEAVEPIQAKGKAEPVPAFSVLAAKPEAPKLRGIAGLDSPLVGRESEITRLQKALERLKQAKGGVVTIVGEAGIGKSRLVTELRKMQGLQSDSLLWLEGRCLSYGATIPYLLWLDVLRSVLDVTLDNSPDIVQDRLQKWVHDLCPDQFGAAYPYLARLLSLPLEAEMLIELAELDGSILKRRTFEAVETVITRAAQRQPLVLVYEDLHWTDPSSLELLRHVLPKVWDAPILLICVSRIRKDHAIWNLFDDIHQHYAELHTDLWIMPLSAIDSDILVANLLHAEAMPPALRDRILHKAEGNPFFVEEVIRSLIDLGAIEYDTASGTWSATQAVETIPIPDTLQGVLTARIDRLEADTRHVLQLASVIGRLFLYRVLDAIAREERDLEGRISVLQRQELIRERARIPELEYIFKHALTQEAAYNGILKRQRRVFHRKVAEAMERLFPDRIDEMLGLLAHHWERAEETDRAVAYLLRAGDFTSIAYAHQEAIEFYERAIALLQKAGERDRTAHTLLKLGQTYHDAFDFEQAQVAYQKAFELWEKQAEKTIPPTSHALRIWLREPDTLDPNLKYVGLPYVSLLFAGLTRRTLDGEAVPAMARSWEILNEGCTYVFHLRQDVCWSDGVPVTAHDFECSWKRLLHPDIKAPYARNLYDIVGAEAFHKGELLDPEEVGVRAVSDHTLTVQLNIPIAYFLKLVSWGATFPIPKHLLEQIGVDWSKPQHLVTNGAFRLESYIPGTKMVLVRQQGGYDPHLGNVQCLQFYHDIDDWASAMKMYQEGRLHVLYVPFTATEQFHPLPANLIDQHHIIDHFLTWFLCFNDQRPPFHDRRVRRALAHASNKEDLVEALANLQRPARGGFIPPGMPGHAPAIGLGFDPDLACKLMRDAGYSQDHAFPHVHISVSHPLLPVANQLAKQWQSTLSIHCTAVPTPDPRWERQCGLYLNGWNADVPDPDNFLWGSAIADFMRWRNDTYKRLVRSGRQIRIQAKRIGLYQEADRLLIEEAVLIPLLYGQDHWLAKPWIRIPKGTTRTAGFLQFNIEDR